MSEKHWLVAEAAPDEWHAQFPELSHTLRHLLWHRGIRTPEAAEEFLHPDYGRHVHDPFLFRDMRKAVERVLEVIAAVEVVGIFGDYDADGVTGSVILASTLRALGAKIEIYIPHREKEGYGLSKAAVSFFLDRGAKIIITCDCGIASVEEIAMAQAGGVAVIITDHHTIPEKIPNAFAILHPLVPGNGYPFLYLTGGGVAFKFACALIFESCKKSSLPTTNSSLPTPHSIAEGFEKWLLDLVAISTVADVGKLIGENRVFVKYGLIVLQKTRRLGLKKLYAKASIDPRSIDAWSIAFQITPRINAAGRMDHASSAFKMLMTETEAEAEEFASFLIRVNTERQKVTERMIEEAKRQIGAGEGKSFLSAYQEDWPLGVVGLVAGRIAEEYGKPTLIACKTPMGHLAGSIRSIPQFDVVPALHEAKSHMMRYGGHPMAAGFSVENIDIYGRLCQKLDEVARERLAGVDMRRTLRIDAELSLQEINWKLWGALESMEPFGEGNSRPKFAARRLSVVAVDRVGNGGKHLRLTVAGATGGRRKMIGFNFGDWARKIELGERVDVAFELGVNEWNGNRELQMKIADLRLSEKEG
ncbi:MAG: single-stranded-DNA-specific exonuclease RecJ [Patescibacteria group bacterium]